ncbi:MAG TPA: helix-turn-helix transcriptional regulator [Chryseolinea sp.]|nr:helix-turn-helix transcriptional regulator [Chryseolinea sp.]
MRYWYQKPHDGLSDYVRTVLVADMLADDGDPKVPLFVAGMPAVFVQLSPGESLRADDVAVTLFGAAVPPDFQLTERHTIVLSYFFMPFAMACLFDLPARRLAQAPITADDWNKREVVRLKLRLAGSQTPAHLISVLDEFFVGLLTKRLHTCEAIRVATDKIMLNPDMDMLSHLPDEVHLTKRTFQRMFKKYVGISPTEYRRICQFQQSFQQVRTRQFDKLSDVAVDNGFADQSHFVRSFREFAQTTPGKYMDEGLQPK